VSTRDDLRGDNTAPSLVGESFMFLWGDMEVGELSAKIQKLMPPERPGSLPRRNLHGHCCVHPEEERSFLQVTWSWARTQTRSIFSSLRKATK